MAKWSEMAGSVKSVERIQEDEERVINRSSICDDEWVENVTWLTREKVSSRLRKGEAVEEEGSSTWKLKSPEMIRSAGEETRCSSRVTNSSQNRDREIIVLKVCH